MAVAVAVAKFWRHRGVRVPVGSVGAELVASIPRREVREQMVWAAAAVAVALVWLRIISVRHQRLAAQAS
jgi:hypothetical protein